MSKGEEKICRLLNEAGIKYEREYSFPSFYGVNGQNYRFDFVIFSPWGDISYCIEFDGEQHFQSISHFGGERAYLANRYRDRKKDEFCRDKHLPLIRIPYKKYDTLSIEDLKLNTSQYIVKD